MAALQSPKDVRLLVAGLLFCSVLPSVFSQEFDPSSQCTSDYQGVPACNFDKRNCYLETKATEEEPAWVYVSGKEHGPFKHYDRGYIYFDPAASQGKRRMLTGNIATGKKAICVDFHYATEENANVPINFYIQTGTKYSLAHRVEANTDGEWKQTSFSCCLPDSANSDQTQIKFGFDVTPSENGTTAIDYMDMRLSTMPCENGELVCYPSPPSQAPLGPGNVQTCPSRQEETGVSSCDFDTKDEANLTTCGWTATGWDVRQKLDGTGLYDTLYSADKTNVALMSNVTDDVDALCMEIQFRASWTEDLANVFSVHVTAQNVSYVWGESYNYNGGEKTLWKRNYFDARLPEGKERQILITTDNKGLQIDSIRFRTSQRPRPTPASDATSTETWETVFQCPVTSSGLVEPFCGMTVSPDQDATAGSRWTEETPANNTETEFSGRPHYFLYNGTGQELKNHRAKLTTKFMNISRPSMATFSYGLSGQAGLEIYAEDENEVRELIWSTQHETARKWVIQEEDIQTAGKMRITFNVVTAGDKLDRQIFAAFSDISIKQQIENSPSPTSAPVKSKDLSTAGQLPNSPATQNVPTESPKSPEETTPSNTAKDNASQKNGRGSGSSAGVIAGSVFGVLIGATLIGGAVWWFYLRNREDSAANSRYVEKMESVPTSPEPHVIENVTYTP